jgi:Na+/H+ antiporter NhaD/arsenite permease-like protein
LAGSIPNLIVADLARQQGMEIGWKRHAVTAVPVTLASLAVVRALV